MKRAEACKNQKPKRHQRRSSVHGKKNWGLSCGVNHGGHETVAMTKADIVEALYEKVGFSKKEAADLVELVFDTIKGTLAQGQKIKISGFGNFVVRDKRSRIGRNPQTGQSIEISARRVLTFRP